MIEKFTQADRKTALYWLEFEGVKNPTEAEIQTRMEFDYERSIVAHYETECVEGEFLLPEDSTLEVYRRYYPEWYQKIIQGEN